MRGLFVTATDTNVGKTWVGRRLLQALIEQGIEVVPRKPVESGWNDDLTQNDAWILANAANNTKDLLPVSFGEVSSATVEPGSVRTLLGSDGPASSYKT